MEPAAPPAANKATTASADFFVVPPVRQTYATGFGARAVPKMGGGGSSGSGASPRSPTCCSGPRAPPRAGPHRLPQLPPT